MLTCLPRLAAAALLLCPAAAAHVQLLSPNGFETFRGQSTVLIEWFDSVSHGNEVSYTLEYSSDGGVHWTLIAANLPYTNGSDSYLWTVPDQATTTGVIRVTMVVNPFLSYDDINDFYFEVEPSYVAYGQGTALNGVVPTLEGLGLPQAGSTIALRASGAQAGALACFVAGNRPDHRPLLGVTLLNSADLGRRELRVDAQGVAETTMPLGSCLTGRTIHVQLLVASAPSSSASAGLGFRVLN